MDTALQLAAIAGRVVLVYLFLIVLLRIMGRGALAELRPIDMLTMLLMSETVSPALTAGDDSLAGGIVAACALGFSAALTSWLTYRYRWLDHVMDGAALVLVENGKLDERVMHKQRITEEELNTALHYSGVLSVSEVKKAFVEPDGAITIVKA
jgi:uncharacterized membrane protein YcaP (DUF421 family)